MEATNKEIQAALNEALKVTMLGAMSPDGWARKVLSELHRQCGYYSDFDAIQSSMPPSPPLVSAMVEAEIVECDAPGSPQRLVGSARQFISIPFTPFPGMICDGLAVVDVEWSTNNQEFLITCEDIVDDPPLGWSFLPSPRHR